MEKDINNYYYIIEGGTLMASLKISKVSKSFGVEKIIEDISIAVHDKEIVTLLGASGVGKTTLFNVASGLEVPEEGQVFLDDEDITGRPGKVSYMLQKDLLLPYRTIEDNVILPLLIKGEKKLAARDKIAPYFEIFGLAGTEKKYPSQLSGGMRQRAALLRTYLFSDKVALLDEPFSGLDTMTRSAIHQWYLGVCEKVSMSTILITHDIDEAILLSDRIYLLGGKPGKIISEIVVNHPRPRTAEFNLTDEFREYKRKILQQLEN